MSLAEQLAALDRGMTGGEWAVNPFAALVDSSELDGNADPIPVCQMLWPTDLRSEAATEANARWISLTGSEENRAKIIAALVEVERLREAMRNIKPYVLWAISDESPSHHPTMPSAVAEFVAALGEQP